MLACLGRRKAIWLPWNQSAVSLHTGGVHNASSGFSKTISGWLPSFTNTVRGLYSMLQFVVHVPLVLFLVWLLNYTLH